MRLVVQRVSSASVKVDGTVISSIGRGVCVLVGIGDKDTEEDLTWCANKLLKVRIFEGDAGKRWDKGVKDKGLEVLCVSQFTLYCRMKGNKPDYSHAMGGDKAKTMYHQFLDKLKTNYQQDKVKDGLFGAMMDVSLTNEGPVTITLDSPQRSGEGDTSEQ